MKVLFLTPRRSAVVDPIQQPYGPIDFDTRNQPAHRHRRIVRRPAQAHVRIRVDRRRALRGFDAGSVRHRLRWHSRPRALHQDMDAGVLSRCLHLRTDPRLDVLQHVRDGLRSRGCRRLLDHARNVAGIDEFADSTKPAPSKSCGTDRAEWTVSLYDIDQRNVFVQINDVTQRRCRRRSRHQRHRNGGRCAPNRRLEALGQCRFHPCAFREFRRSGGMLPATRRRT